MKNVLLPRGLICIYTYSKKRIHPDPIGKKKSKPIHDIHTQRVAVTGQLRVNGKVRHLRRCTLEDQSLAHKSKHRVHKYVNTSAICVSVMNSFILT